MTRPIEPGEFFMRFDDDSAIIGPVTEVRADYIHVAGMRSTPKVTIIAHGTREALEAYRTRARALRAACYAAKQQADNECRAAHRALIEEMDL